MNFNSTKFQNKNNWMLKIQKYSAIIFILKLNKLKQMLHMKLKIYKKN